jgi:acyl-CoA thioesterase FadM
VLDEAMGWAMYAAGAWAMTARMEVKYRRPLPLGVGLTVTAEVTRERGRILDAAAQISDRQGVLAEAKGMFVRLPPDKQSEFQRYFTGSPEQVVPG